MRQKRVNEDHISQLKGFTHFYKSIPNGACLTNCAAVHIHGNENERTQVKSKVNNHIADNYDKYYINEIELPFIETIGTGEEARQINITTGEDLKKFLRDPNSGSLLVFSNQQEIKALCNIFNTNIHIFIYDKENCFSPIPSLALHCTNVNSVFGLSPNINAKELWEKNKN